MKMKVLENEPNKIVFLLEDSKPALANALRRVILGEVPVMAINEVTMYENTSVMFDEYVAHRLGMIPLTTDLKNYKKPGECCGGNCSSCSVDFTIDETGPKSVHSSDMKTSDPKVKPVSGKIPIVDLDNGQRLRLEAKAVLGTGEEHARWQAGNAAYRSVSEVKLNKEGETRSELMNLCPKNVFGIKKDKVFVEKPMECNACNSCVETYPEGVEVTPNQTKFLFKVWTDGQMTAQKTLVEAIKVLEQKNKEMKKLVDSMK
ncbi:MAG: DNA-directed RNA polymerase subunit D [Candidatus Diapherotrites archaeon]|nr:DNA-directed RNA polymerase subunit D [Candidatus Diapherotrites archaeon]